MANQREPEFQGPAYKHPYFLYILLTVVLFLVLAFIGYLGYRNDWIPKR